MRFRKLILSGVLITGQQPKERHITNEVYTSSSSYNDKGNFNKH